MLAAFSKFFINNFLLLYNQISLYNFSLSHPYFSRETSESIIVDAIRNSLI